MTSADASLARLRASWTEAHATTIRVGCVVVGAAALIGACWLARLGTLPTRISAAGLALLGVGGAWLARRLVIRRQSSAALLLRQALASTDPRLGAAARRTLTLRAAVATSPELGSSSLVELHLRRILARVPWNTVTLRAARRSWRWSIALGVVALSASAAVLYDPLRVVEGLSVLLARSGKGAVALDWIAGRGWVAEPPSYLRRRAAPLDAQVPIALPVGTELVLRAVPLRPGRELTLTDGQETTPLVEDGDGGLVGRWTVRQDATLWVAGRFGAVLVHEPVALEVHAVADLAPAVRVKGAPRTVRLLDEPRVGVHFEATDDHGLRQVDLVLRAGTREERRPLSRPMGGVRYDRGGVDLRLDDEFLRAVSLPVEAVVEVQDDDDVSGPKWTRSAPLVLIPPHVAEREALRYEALEKLRDGLTDLLAERLLRPADTKAVGEVERSAQQPVADRAAALFGADFGGLGFNGIARALTRGQLERLERALAALARQPGPVERQKLLVATEQAVLGVDAALASLDDADSRAAARLLSDVATEVVTAINAGRVGGEAGRNDARLDAALEVLAAGATQLLRLGTLGQDLGESVQAGLRRIRRALGAGDRFHAKLAAEDLAVRLRVPDPAFRSAGGSGSNDVEAGGQPAVEEGDGAESAAEAAGLQRSLDELRERHAAEMSSVERALEEGMRQARAEQDAAELQRRADAMREAASELPRTGAGSSSSQSAAAAARAQAESMAAAAEQGDMREAVKQGKDAMDSLAQAEALGRDAAAGSRDAEAGQLAAAAKQKLAGELAWAEGALGKLERATSDRVGDQLGGSAAREKELAAEARALREQSDQSRAPMPQATLDRLAQAARAMDQAAQLLGQRQGPRGAEQQQRAQRLLELAQPEQDEAPEAERGQSGDGTRMGDQVAVPGEHRDERAARFRERVARGLQGSVPPQLRDALRRYAEGLVR